MSNCRNCGKQCGLPSCTAWNKHGTFCQTCNFANKTEPPFQIDEVENAKELS